MQISEDKIKEFKKLYEKEYGKKLSDREAHESAQNLINLAQLFFEIHKRDCKNKEKLKGKPRGFYLSELGNGIYTCLICRQSISGESGWYDKYGPKCLCCQKAIERRIIPASVVKDDKSWYSPYDLKSRFNIDHHVMKRFIKADILKPRIIKNFSGKSHFYLFLIKDNSDTLPPKELTESKLAKEVGKDGEEWFCSEPWYKFVDPFEVLKDYKITNYLNNFFCH